MNKELKNNFIKGIVEQISGSQSEGKSRRVLEKGFLVIFTGGRCWGMSIPSFELGF